jgi:hypothetical protein
MLLSLKSPRVPTLSWAWTVPLNSVKETHHCDWLTWFSGITREKIFSFQDTPHTGCHIPIKTEAQQLMPVHDLILQPPIFSHPQNHIWLLLWLSFINELWFCELCLLMTLNPAEGNGQRISVFHVLHVKKDCWANSIVCHQLGTLRPYSISTQTLKF